MQQTKNLRTGFIGCGNIAHFHADVLKHLGVQITCLSYRSNKPKAELFAQKYGIAKIYTDWHEMITESEIDFLWVIPSWDQIDLIFEEVAAIGKTSTYALKEWDMVKTGTIKELVKEFLESAPDPKHISEIALYVNKFRRTTDKNILSNLKLDKTNTYVFFKLGYIGLKYKQYKNIQIQSDKKTRGRKPKISRDDNQLSLI